MSQTPEGLRDLAIAVRERMTELRMNQPAVAAAGGPSGVTLRKLLAAEEGKPPEGLKSATLAALDAALRWVPGTAADVLRGGDPRSLPNSRRIGSVVVDDGNVVTLRLSSAAMAALEGKSPAELEEALLAASREYLRVLREQDR